MDGAVADDGVEGLFQAREMHEGIAAFLEKRRPDFDAEAQPLDEAGGQ